MYTWNVCMHECMYGYRVYIVCVRMNVFYVGGFKLNRGLEMECEMGGLGNDFNDVKLILV